MKHIKLFESFVNESEDKDKNISKRKAKKPAVEVKESEATDKEAKELDDELEKLFKKLVPSSGPAETLEGEMVRAIMRIHYRYFNDGDVFFRGYGKETVMPSVQWLRTKSPLAKELKAAFSYAQKNALRDGHNNQWDTEKDGYLVGLNKATKIIVDYVKSKNGKYTPTTEDSRS